MGTNKPNIRPETLALMAALLKQVHPAVDDLAAVVENGNNLLRVTMANGATYQMLTEANSEIASAWSLFKMMSFK